MCVHPSSQDRSRFRILCSVPLIGTAAKAIYFLSYSDYCLLFPVYIYFEWKVAEFLIFCPSMSSLSLVSSVNISELSHRLCASLFKLLLEILAVLMFSRSMTSCSCFIWSAPSCFYLSDIDVLLYQSVTIFRIVVW